MKIRGWAYGFIIIGVIGLAGSPLYPQSTKEKTMKVDGSTIEVNILGVSADIVGVKPYIKAKEGKKKGNLWLDVTVKNTGSKPQAYNIFGQGKTDSGGWAGGALKAPKDGTLDPGKTATVKVKTRYEGETIPKAIRVDVLPPQ